MITVNRPIEGGDFGSAGSATRLLKDHLRSVGVPVDALRRAMIASYEAEMNVVIHARRGSLWARMDDQRLDLEVVDEGPGIPDIELALREGWSTASEEARRMGFGAGMGLPNIRRNSDRFEIDSQPGRGTRVRSTILLAARPVAAVVREQADAPVPAPGIRADRCRGCHACLAACPTAALRVRDAGPQLLASRCIGCTECATACPDRVFTLDAPDAVDGVAVEGAALVVPAGFLAGFAAPPATVLSALSSLGFVRVGITEEWARALRREALVRARRGEGPLVAPSCPAVVALVESRFPVLLRRMAPLATPPAAAVAGFTLQRVVVVPACPAQREAVLAEGRAGRISVARPEELAAAVRPLLAGAVDGTDEAAAAARDPDDDARGVLRVTGMRHVLRALELAEAGALPDVVLIEPFACDGGCLGSPYLGIDPFVAAHRLAPAPPAGCVRAAAVERSRAPAPRPGARLDPDMGTAIRMLGAIDAAARALPGRDCGSCGAPTCAVFAEDLVVGRAGASDCPHRTRPIGRFTP